MSFINKKGLVLVLCLILAISAFTGCSNKKTDSEVTKSEVENQTNEVAQEEKKQEAPVKIFASITGGKDPEEHELWVKAFSEASGVDIEMQKFEGNEYSEKVAAAIAAGDDYDVFYLNADDFEKFFKMGVFEPITSYIEESEVLSDPSIIDPKEWDRIRRVDGEIYAVFTKYEGGRLPLVRGDWLQKLNIKPPTTLDGYYEMLKAFTTMDPDGNGKDDTYGFTMKKTYDIQPFMSTQGLVPGFAYDDNHKLYYPWASDKAAVIYDWLAKLYKEGILDPNIATNSSSNCRELIFSSRAGMFTYWDAWAGQFNEIARGDDPNTIFEMKGIAPPLDENGNAILTAGQDGLFVINRNSKNKDFAFKALEFLHTQEGNMLTTLGIEGHDYTVENTEYKLTEIGQGHGMNHGSMTPKSLKWKNPLGEAMGTPEAREVVLKYAKPEMLTQHSKGAKDIVDKYAMKAIMGEISGEEAVKAMQKEMKAENMID
ncbi:extracellular solute-binding protein [Wukongibacter baidiensis]|uniref:extracellular solute-binding protein n=1 Tax=Wukongibacter baidiensis TaxID=1723361 RepID=UPI003D7FD318